MNSNKVYKFKAFGCAIESENREIMEICKGRISVYHKGEGKFILCSEDDFFHVINNLAKSQGGEYAIGSICEHAEHITDERSLFLAIFHVCRRENPLLSHRCVFYLTLDAQDQMPEIRIDSIDNREE